MIVRMQVRAHGGWWLVLRFAILIACDILSDVPL